jgi:hypothetical protein
MGDHKNQGKSSQQTAIKGHMLHHYDTDAPNAKRDQTPTKQNGLAKQFIRLRPFWRISTSSLTSEKQNRD